jgi:hypothetical protein
MPAAIYLDQFGQHLFEAFGETPFLVGSALYGKEWRDVDVRVILDDDVFDNMFPGWIGAGQNDMRWSIVCAAFSELGRARTGLPIDFQIQRMTDANASYQGPREPLMVITHREGSP